jgi:hypothetical protein
MRVVFFAEAFDEGINVRGDTVAPMRTKGDDRAGKNDGDSGLA